MVVLGGEVDTGDNVRDNNNNNNSGSTVFTLRHCLLCRRTSMTVLIFIARAFIAGGFQAAYVYTPEVRCQLR